MFQPFEELLPEIAVNETRSIFIMQKAPHLPPIGQYVFLELFCTDIDCDCRNVMIVVFHVETQQTITRIRYCWEKKSYYDGINLLFERDLPDIFLDFLCSSPYDEYFVNTFKEMCYSNIHSKQETDYAKRLKRHYQQFREQLRKNQRDSDEAVELMVPKPYELCPCASGKKFKFCCSPILVHVAEAMCLAEDGFPEEALNKIKQAEKIVGTTAEILCRRAIVYSFSNHKLYAECLQKCLELNPKHPRAHYLQGIDFKKKEQYKESIESYFKAVQNYPATDHYHLNEVYNNIANVYYEMGEQDKAITYWKKALTYYPTDKTARMNLQKFGGFTLFDKTTS